MVRSRHSAFTLVELLVVITIIGMLMAILLPAVGAATESARAAQCKNRVKQIALAMASYESRNQAFPGYVDGVEVGNDVNPYSWIVAIMPDMERQDIFDLYKSPDPTTRLHAGNTDPYLDFLVCPSDPPLQKQALTSYVANAGHAEADLAGCGILNRQFPLRQRAGGKKIIHQRTSLDKISSGDGASQTILISENIQAGRWNELAFFSDSGMNIASGIGNPALKPKGSLPANVIVWKDVVGPANPADELASSGPKVPTIGDARPSSEHRGGSNVAFADGHVSFVKEPMDNEIYARLLSTDGKKCEQSFGAWRNSSTNVNHQILVTDTDLQ